MAAPSETRPNMREVARLAKVSIATVSRVLNDHPSASDKARQAVLDAVDALGYRPDAAFSLAFKRQHQGLRGQPIKTRTLAYLTTQFIRDAAMSNDGFYGAVVSGFNTAICDAGYHMLWEQLEPDQTELPACVREHRVDGVIVDGTADPALREQLSRLLPTVFVGRPYNSTSSSCVLANYSQAVNAQLEYLWELGHRRVACFVPVTSCSYLRDLVRGFEDFHADHGVAPSHPALCTPREISPETHERVLRDYVQELLAASDRPTAVLALNVYAIPIQRFLQEQGVRVPHDISVIGVNETPSNTGQYASPPMTSWQMPQEAIGRTAAEMLMQRIEKKTDVQECLLLNGHRIERASCARAASKSV